MPRRLRGDNSALATMEDARVVVAEAFEEARLYAHPLPGWDEADRLRVARLDLAMDLRPVPNIGSVLDALDRVLRPRNMRAVSKRQAGEIVWLEIGPSSRWSVVLYDRASRSPYCETLRVEARLRRTSLRDKWVQQVAKIDRVFDLQAADLDLLYKTAVRRARLDATIAGADHVLGAVLAEQSLSNHRKIVALGLLTHPQCIELLGRSSQTTYRRILRDLGLTVATCHAAQTCYLDFDQGRLGYEEAGRPNFSGATQHEADTVRTTERGPGRAPTRPGPASHPDYARRPTK